MKQGKRWMAWVLALTLIIAALSPMTALAAPRTQKVTAEWHFGGKNGGFYNPADEGKEVAFWFFIDAKGTNEETGQVEDFHFAFNPKTNTIGEKFSTTIGETVQTEIPLDTITLPNGKVYKNFELTGSGVGIDQDNHIYSRAGGVNTRTKELHATFHQNMETATKVELADPDQIVLDSDKGDMNVYYYALVSENGGERKRVQNNRRQDISATAPFEETNLVMTDLNRGARNSFLRGVVQNSLGMYNPFTGKYRTLFLKAEWADGARKADIAERYNLTVNGDDLKGWTVTLRSKIKVDTAKTEKTIPYTTVYEDDPTMYVGQERTKTPGVDGKEEVITSTYYLPQQDGTKKVLETQESKQTTLNPVNRVILRGTKTRPSSGGSDITIDTTIYVDPNGGKFSDGTTAVKSYAVTVGERFTLPEAPIREGYKFLYWKGSEYQPGENYIVPAGGHTFIAEWEKDEKKPEDKPSVPSVDSNIKTPRGSALTHDEIAKILAGMKNTVPAIPKAGVGR